MSLEFNDLQSLKTYKTAIKSALRSVTKSPYKVIEFQFIDTSKKVPVLLVGKDTKKIIEKINTDHKGTKNAPVVIIDEGQINEGVITSIKGKLKKEMIPAWGVDDLIRFDIWLPDDLIPGSNLTGVDVLNAIDDMVKKCEKYTHASLKSNLEKFASSVRTDIKNGDLEKVIEGLGGIRQISELFVTTAGMQEKLDKLKHFGKGIDQGLVKQNKPPVAEKLIEDAQKSIDNVDVVAFAGFMEKLNKLIPSLGEQFPKLSPGIDKLRVRDNEEALNKADQKISAAYKNIKSKMEQDIVTSLKGDNEDLKADVKKLQIILDKEMKSDLYKLLLGIEKCTDKKHERTKKELTMKAVQAARKYMSSLNSNGLVDGGFVGTKYYYLLRHINSHLTDSLLKLDV